MKEYVVIQVFASVEKVMAHSPEHAASLRSAVPVEAGYEVREEVQGAQYPEGRVVHETGWPSAFRRDLSTDRLLKEWFDNQGAKQKK